MNNTDLFLSDILGILESKSEDAFRGFLCDEFNTLHDAIDNDVLDARVLSLCVFTDESSVNIVIRSLVASNGPTGTDVGEQVESSSQREIKRDVTLPDRGLIKHISDLFLEGKKDLE